MTPIRVTLYRDAEGKWRWRATAANGEIDGASSQGFRSKYYAKRKARKAYPDAVFIDPAT